MSETAVIIIPAYNEEANIGMVVSEAKSNFPKSLILVVDDGSEDKTGEIAKKYGAFVLKNKKNLGKSESTKKAAKYLFEKHPEIKEIALIDADNQYSAKELKKLIKPIIENKADFVIGRRDFSDIPSFGHRPGIKIFAFLFNFLYGTSFRDTVCGLRAISVEALKRMELESSGYAVESEMLVDAVQKGMKIKSAAVRVRYNRRHTLKKGTTMLLNIILHLILWRFFDRKVVEDKILKIMKLYQKIV